MLLRRLDRAFARRSGFVRPAALSCGTDDRRLRPWARSRAFAVTTPRQRAQSCSDSSALRSALRDARGAGCAAVVLSGRPGCFSAGLDVPELLRLDRTQMRATWEEFFGLFFRVASVRDPHCRRPHGPQPGGRRGDRHLHGLSRDCRGGLPHRAQRGRGGSADARGLASRAGARGGGRTAERLRGHRRAAESARSLAVRIGRRGRSDG